jgi:hypothetical protein
VNAESVVRPSPVPPALVFAPAIAAVALPLAALDGPDAAPE